MLRRTSRGASECKCDLPGSSDWNPDFVRISRCVSTHQRKSTERGYGVAEICARGIWTGARKTGKLARRGRRRLPGLEPCGNAAPTSTYAARLRTSSRAAERVV